MRNFAPDNDENLNEKDEAIPFLGPSLDLLYEGFEAAIDKAKEYFDINDCPFDPFVYATLVRYHLKLFCKNNDIKVIYEAVKEMSNIGLEFQIGNYRIRIRKGKGKTIAGQTHSQTFQEFCNQQQPLPGFTQTLNLVLLWEATGKGDLVALTLGKPLSVKLFKWVHTLPHPATHVADNTGDFYQPSLEEEDFVGPFTDDEFPDIGSLTDDESNEGAG